MSVDVLAPGGGWTVEAMVDRDGHLNLWLYHKDGSAIMECSGDTCEDEQRYTTEDIEAAHHATKETA